MKTKLFVVALLFLAFGRSVVTPVQAQPPPGKPPKKAHQAATQIADSNAAAAQTVVAQDTEPNAVRLSPQNLPQDPLRVTIQNAVNKGMQAAQLSVAVPHVAPNAASTGVPDSATPGRQRRRPSANSTGPTDSVAVPAGPQAGIAALQGAQSSVSSAAQQKWGGHKMKAAGLISQALAACGQTTTPPRQAQAGTADPSAAMLAALQQLASAKSALAAATNACGGGRDQAIALITQAQSEVQASIDFAKSH
jgi:hypothetical protein